MAPLPRAQPRPTPLRLLCTNDNQPVRGAVLRPPRCFAASGQVRNAGPRRAGASRGRVGPTGKRDRDARCRKTRYPKVRCAAQLSARPPGAARATETRAASAQGDLGARGELGLRAPPHNALSRRHGECSLQARPTPHLAPHPAPHPPTRRPILTTPRAEQTAERDWYSAAVQAYPAGDEASRLRRWCSLRCSSALRCTELLVALRWIGAWAGCPAGVKPPGGLRCWLRGTQDQYCTDSEPRKWLCLETMLTQQPQANADAAGRWPLLQPHSPAPHRRTQISITLRHWIPGPNADPSARRPLGWDHVRCRAWLDDSCRLSFANSKSSAGLAHAAERYRIAANLMRLWAALAGQQFREHPRQHAKYTCTSHASAQARCANR